MALAATLTLASAKYTLKSDLSHKNFFSQFSLYTGPDPTKGFVNYQNLTSAIANQYVGYLNESVFLGVDYTSKDPAGRASVRAESNERFNKGLLIADIAHMPENICGTWPAFWLLGADPWPQHGEIDILEGVNDYDRNAVTLHTSAGCAVDNATMGPAKDGEQAQQEFTGYMATSNCDVQAADQDKNVGCSVKAPSKEAGDSYLPSYGKDFNDNGGGVYTLEWTDSFIQAWFFPRNAQNFPDTTQMTESPDPSGWGTPLAKFQGQGCNFNERFKDLRIIFNTAFCGEWAGAEKEWEKSCKKKTGVDKCADYVRDNPQAFENVYWEIKGLRWFEQEQE